MHMHAQDRLPPIALTARDVERLDRLASSAARQPAAAFLAREIARAEILPDGGAQPDLVMMGSMAHFRDEETGKARWVTLVYPQDADMSDGRLSVLTPIGAALIGLRAGQSIAFTTPAGSARSLTVLAVRNPSQPMP